jgi:hypothetical protein
MPGRAIVVTDEHLAQYDFVRVNDDGAPRARCLRCGKTYQIDQWRWMATHQAEH